MAYSLHSSPAKTHNPQPYPLPLVKTPQAIPGSTNKGRLMKQMKSRTSRGKSIKSINGTMLKEIPIELITGFAKIMLTISSMYGPMAEERSMKWTT